MKWKFNIEYSNLNSNKLSEDGFDTWASMSLKLLFSYYIHLAYVLIKEFLCFEVVAIFSLSCLYLHLASRLNSQDVLAH